MGKKPFKETVVGKFITSKLPGFVGDILPDKGVLGIIKNLIDADPDMSAEDKLLMQSQLKDLSYNFV